MVQSGFQDSNCMTLEKLNDDCLIHIFEFLNKKEKLRIERVSKRWNTLSKLSWSKINTIAIDPNKKFDGSFFPERKRIVYTNYLIKIFNLSSLYLKKLTLILYNARKYLNIYELLENILKTCIHVTHLSIKEDVIKIVTEEYLNNFFKQASDLSYISMKGVIVYGNCFMNLKSLKIKELTMHWCEFENFHIIITFIMNLKNLNYLNIKDEMDIVGRISLALYHSNCDQLKEISISLCEYRSLSLFYTFEFFHKQKDLRVLKLKSVSIDEKLMKLTPKNIEKIDFKFIKEQDNYIILKYLPNFQSIKIFKCTFEYITDEQFKLFSKSININVENIDISFIDILSSNPVTHFSRLQKLEFFSINNEYNDGNNEEPLLIDNILNELLKCKNLKFLQIKNNGLFTENILSKFKKMPKFIDTKILKR